MMIDMADYYDLVLGAIPLTVASIAGSLLVVGVAAALAVAVASTAAAGLVGHAMFVRTPGSAAVEQSTPAPAAHTEGPAFEAAD
jgi:hypothetical protein